MWLYTYFIIMMLETQIFNIQQSVTSGKADDFNHVSILGACICYLNYAS